MQSQVRFNRAHETVPEKVREALVQSRVLCEGSEGRGGFKSQVRLNRVAEKVPEKVWKALLQSQVRFNRVPRRRF